MQILISTGTLLGSQPIYLPYDKAPVPFGDPMAATLTSAGPSVVTVKGYTPTLNDAVSITIEGPNGYLSSQALLSTGFIQVSQTYYVTPAGGQSFTLSTAKGSISSAASLTTFGQAGGIPIVHLLSNQVDGTVYPFKSGGSVVAWNGGAGNVNTGSNAAPITFMGASDISTVYGNPQGPGAYSVIATVGFGAPQIVQLNYDWIVASGSTSTLILLQN